MRTRRLILASILVCIADSATGETTVPTMPEVFALLRAYSASFDAQIPDFVAEESLISRRLGPGGAVAKEVRATSKFTCIRNQRARSPRFLESRHLITVDGVPYSGAGKLRAPMMTTGGFSVILSSTIAEENEKYQSFVVEGFEMLAGQQVLAVSFSTRKDNKEMRFQYNGKWIPTEDVGRIWIDWEAKRVLRVERSFAGLPGGAKVSMRAEYGEVAIDGRPFWLPVSVSAETREEAKVRTFSADYRNFMKFAVETRIQYDRP